MTPPITRQAEDQRLALKYYDAGYLGNGGGGDIEWWQNYIRSLLEDAHQFYAGQFAHPPQVGDGREDEITLLMGSVEREHYGCRPLPKIEGEGWGLARKFAQAAIRAIATPPAPLRAAAEPGEMRDTLELALHHLDNSDSPGGCNGRHKDCGHCQAIAKVRKALCVLSPASANEGER